MGKQLDAGNALISVFNKEGIVPFAKGLSELGWSIVSSGGTAEAIKKAGIPVTEVADITGWGSMLDGRVKTLHPLIHGGILADLNNPDHVKTLKEKDIRPFGLVCVDMYPLEETIANPAVPLPDIIEKIDVGGPTMLNGAAKSRKIVLSRADQREAVLKWLREGKPNEKEFLDELASTAFYETMRYYSPLVKYLGGTEFSVFIGKKLAPTKYGENPQQADAGLYADNRVMTDSLSLDQFEHLKGWELSYVNETDIDRLTQTTTHIAAGFERNFGHVPAIAVGVKHGNACGAGVGNTSVEAVKKMLEGDTRAIHGGVVMVNGEVNALVAELLMTHANDGAKNRLLDGVVAASFTKEALDVLKRAKLRAVINPALGKLNQASMDTSRRQRPVRGALLEQPNYDFIMDLSGDYIEQHGELTQQQKEDLILGWAIGCTSNSNTIVLVKDGQLIGNGVGQQDRVGAGQLAATRTTTNMPTITEEGDTLIMKIELDKRKLKGAVAYSDSFFPFEDGPQLLTRLGVSAILASRGAMLDESVKDAILKDGTSFVTVPDKVGRGFYAH